MAEPELEAAPAEEEAPAPAPAVEAEPAGPHDVALSAAQISEIWKSPSADAGLALLARCLAMPEDYEEDMVYFKTDALGLLPRSILALKTLRNDYKKEMKKE